MRSPWRFTWNTRTVPLPPIVDAAWLAARRDEVVLADVRFYLDGRDPRAAYDAGHIPGAVYVDLHRWLAAAPSDEAGRHPLPTPEHFAEGLGRAGIGDETAVVAYDDAGGVIAARLVWMLRAIGHDAALLDGGIPAWPGALTTDEPPSTPRTFTPRPWPADRLVSLTDIAGGGVADAVLIDARQRQRFHGEPDGVDPRAGHIPGARAMPTREHLGADGTLRPVDELRAAFAAAGIGAGTDVISYCGSGVTACHNLLVLEHAGLGRHRLYPGSWSQWSRTDLPIATDDE
jgi:thiosulfate/3-mercaptopyruvate sulfurtransferase